MQNFIYIIQIISIILLVFFERKDPSHILAWILVIFFLPVVGIFFYFFFGSTLKLKFERKYRRIKKVEEEYLKFISKEFFKLENNKNKLEDIKDYSDLIILNTKSSMGYYTENNDAEIFTSAKDKFDMLFKDIENAKESIDIIYFIFNPKDKIGKKFLDLLVKKAKQKVKVRLIYDRFGNYKNRLKDFKPLLDEGGEVIPYMPSFLKTILQINYRMHRKVVIIDKKIAYTGGINVGDEYLQMDKKLFPWRDTSIKLKGPCVSFFNFRFITDYIFLKNKKEIINEKYNKKILNNFSKENIGVQIISSGPDSKREFIKDGYIKMINLAKKYVYIETPYFIPDESFLNAIKLCVLSGVDVRIIIPKIPDKKYIYYITLSYLETLLNWNVKVYMYNGFIHSKMIVIDDMVSTIGSSNIDIRSFRLNYELNSFLYGEKIGKECKEIFVNDIKDSKEVKIEEFKNRKIFLKIMERLFRIFIPLA